MVLTLEINALLHQDVEKIRFDLIQKKNEWERVYSKTLIDFGKQFIDTLHVELQSTEQITLRFESEYKNTIHRLKIEHNFADRLFLRGVFQLTDQAMFPYLAEIDRKSG